MIAGEFSLRFPGKVRIVRVGVRYRDGRVRTDRSVAITARHERLHFDNLNREFARWLDRLRDMGPWTGRSRGLARLACHRDLTEFSQEFATSWPAFVVSEAAHDTPGWEEFFEAPENQLREGEW